MKTTNYLRSFGTGLVGYILAGVVGSVAIFLIFSSRALGLFLKPVPAEQPLVRLLAGILLAFLGIGLGAAAGGVLRGYVNQRVDPDASQRRNLLAGAFSSGISQGILLIPFLLVIALVGLYNNGSAKDPASFAALFGIFGLIYGLIFGLIQGLVTLRLRYFWLVLLAAILGYGLGGMVTGLLLWKAGLFSLGTTGLVRSLVRLLSVSICLESLAGGLIGLAYHWVAVKRAAFGSQKVTPRRWQDISVVAISAIVFLLVAGFLRTAAEFVTIVTGTTTTQLIEETLGVHYADPQGISPGTGSLSVGANSDRLPAVTWVQADTAPGEVVYAYAQPDAQGNLVWSAALNVSASPQTESAEPQVVVDPAGAAHLIWIEKYAERSGILYSRCQAGECTPAVEISGEGCQQSSGNASSPALALSDDGTLMAAWDAGESWIAHAAWSINGSVPPSMDGCFAVGAQGTIHPRLAAGPAGDFAMAYTVGEGQNQPIFLAYIQNGAWQTEADKIGQGSAADVYIDGSGQVTLAWCDASGLVNVQAAGSAVEQIPFPSCQNRPLIGEDADGLMHLVWYSTQIADVFGQTKVGSEIYESIQATDGWSPAAIVSRTKQPAEPALASSHGAFHLVWADDIEGNASIFYAQQLPYVCSTDNLSSVEQAMLGVIQSGEFHPPAYQPPFCGNHYQGFIHMPNPRPEFSSEPKTPYGGFDKLAELIEGAQYEVLLSNMQWDPDQDEQSPGYRLSQAVGDLYRKVKTNPEQYPRGLTVRILLGNYPSLSTLQWGDQIWGLVEDLSNAGVESMEDPEIGWKMEIANYKGVYPHSHTKFVVIDGKTVVSAGFNISWLHLSQQHPSDKGDSLVDLGLEVSGPVAQAGLSTFDDEWNGANQLYCPDLRPEASETWDKECEWKIAVVSHVPEALKYYLPGDQENAYSLYRTSVYKEADEVYVAALAAATETIDAIRVNFSLELICMANIVFPEVCTFENALPWMNALVDAVELNDVKVRVLVETSNSNGLENRVAIQVLEDELERRGLSENVEVRFFNGRVHTKSALIDKQVLFVGSQNFHYSSFSAGGLLEYVVATNSPEAIQEYQQMFDFYWEQGIPPDEADWGTTSGE